MVKNEHGPAKLRRGAVHRRIMPNEKADDVTATLRRALDLRFVDDKSATTAVDAKTGRGMRALLTIAVIASVLPIFDAAALGGRLRQTAWCEAQTEAHMFSQNLHQIMQFAGSGR
jgi:hypothetical protein